MAGDICAGRCICKGRGAVIDVVTVFDGDQLGSSGKSTYIETCAGDKDVQCIGIIVLTIVYIGCTGADDISCRDGIADYINPVIVIPVIR